MASWCLLVPFGQKVGETAGGNEGEEECGSCRLPGVARGHCYPEADKSGVSVFGIEIRVVAFAMV